MDTIVHKQLLNVWNGRFTVDEVKEFCDDRGSLCEVWRADDDKMNNSNVSPQMSYWSITKPFIVRGPHEHVNQIDFFISWKSQMVYQMYNKEANELKYFITEPNKIYRIKVAEGIVHSYRNLSLNDSLTGNFPTSLFMGKDKVGYTKTEKIDEIRHEELITPNKNIWILGANGRLGKAITNQLFNDMGYHNYNVIPIFERIESDYKKLNEIFNHIITNKTENDIVINCIAKTNVQDNDADFIFSNVLIPIHVSKLCLKHNIRLLHFSTDYVFQSGEVSLYTKSKQKFEYWLNNTLEYDDMQGFRLDHIKKYIKVIRLSNLFSLNKDDKHNLLNKIGAKFLEKNIKVPKHLILMPTSVESISKYLSASYVHKFDEQKQFTGLTGKCYNIFDLKEKIVGSQDVSIIEIEKEKLKVINNTEIFLENNLRIELDCDQDITQKIKDL